MIVEAQPTQAMMIRFEVPVDDQWHPIAVPALCGPQHIGCRQLDKVEFWTHTISPVDPDGGRVREFRVVGTGQPFDLHSTAYHGTAIAPDGQQVWHLIERVQEGGL